MKSTAKALRLAFLLLAGIPYAPAQVPGAFAVEEAMRRANDYFRTYNPPGPADWIQGTYHAGNLRAGEVLADESYIDYTRQWGVLNEWKIGWPWPISGSPDPSPRMNADAQVAGQVWLDLYAVDGLASRKSQIKAVADDLLANALWYDGVADTVDDWSDDDWYWVDAFFMAGPTLARLATVENNEAYRGLLRRMWLGMKTHHGLYDPAEGLWYRDRAAKLETSPNGRKVFWSRGNGWVLAGLVRVLERLPAQHPDRAEYETVFRAMCAALLPLQGGDGLWRSNLLDPAHYPNPESSGTAFFVYAYAWGMRQGLLDETEYLAATLKGWEGLVSVALQPSGLFGYVQPAARAPGPALATQTRAYAVGAFLLAGSELLLWIGGPAPVYPLGTNGFSVPEDPDFHARSVLLDASATLVRSGSPPRMSWWRGDIFLAEGPSPNVWLPQGTHAITLRIEQDGVPPVLKPITVTVRGQYAELTSVEASAHDGNKPEQALDGNPDTRWSALGIGQWIQIGMDAPRTVAALDIAFYLGNQRRSTFDLWVSEDGVAWTVALTNAQSSGSTLDYERFPLALQQPVRYLRVIGKGNTSSGAWNSITELRVPLPPANRDLDGNGLPDAWERRYFGRTGVDPEDDPDADGASTRDEFRSGSNPSLRADVAKLTFQAPGASPDVRVRFKATAALDAGMAGLRRLHRVFHREKLEAGTWEILPGAERIAGDNLSKEIPAPPGAPSGFYRIESWLEAEE
jgi:unsaturated rhamnogalacturonyl hydrolase